ncbi:MAG: hypothetical protein QM638_12230 [Nocardioides sp.]|uniref:hypothetical protein n=1 Tax=Nocardioides sp. TaxID=35761 RepID=UPI0039E3717D
MNMLPDDTGHADRSDDADPSPDRDVPDRIPFTPLISSQADLEEAWRRLMRPLGWSRRALWFLCLGDDDRPLPVIHEVSDLPEPFEPDDAAKAAELWRVMLDEFAPDGSLAVLLVRPGTGSPDPLDARIAAALYAACRRARVPTQVIHLAHDHAILPIPYDVVGQVSA